MRLTKNTEAPVFSSRKHERRRAGGYGNGQIIDEESVARDLCMGGATEERRDLRGSELRASAVPGLACLVSPGTPAGGSAHPGCMLRSGCGAERQRYVTNWYETILTR